MKVIRSKLIGYCHGVSQTVKLANQVVQKGKAKKLPYYSIGELIHNPQVVNSFKEKGLKVISKPQDGQPGVALVRAHGIPSTLRLEFEKAGYYLVDSTCINIVKSQKAIKANVKNGRQIIIFGVKGHAETECLLGTDAPGAVFHMVTCIEDLPELFEKVGSQTPICLITQTTFPAYTYDSLLDAMLSHYDDVVIGNRLCHACIQRKNNGVELAEMVDAVIVVGGKNSENTKDLTNWIARSGKPVFCIESVLDFDSAFDEKLRQFETVGLASGTSTPQVVIEEVSSHLQAL